MTNRQYWDRLKKPPASALKEIRGGRLKGMTNINPQWRLEAMTDVFGPCGIGWRYSIDRLWTESTGDEVLSFALVAVQFSNGGDWSDPIPGIGGSKLVSVERGGIHNNDEAFKMAVTDALSVALKALGVGSDIYSGLWDGDKYHQRPEYMVSADLLNSLKLAFAEVNEDALAGLDRTAKQQQFSAWCLAVIGEHVDYHDPAAWERGWVDRCLAELRQPGGGSDVPFDA